MRTYLTVADAAYLPRLKVLHASMLRHCGDFLLYVLPWDETVRVWLWSQGSNRVMSWDHRKIDEWQTEPLPGPPRTLHERMWSSRAAATAALLRTGEADSVLQLDADLCFFGSPEAALRVVEDAGAPAGLMPHYFAPASDGLPGITEESHGKYGRFNSGTVFVRSAALAQRWADETRAWCYFHLDEQGRFADQPNLQEWPALGAVEFPPWFAPGPWTKYKWAVHECECGECGKVTMVGQPLVAWHFSSLRLAPDGELLQLANAEYAVYAAKQGLIYGVYEPYIRELRSAMGIAVD